jgi:hypothetical protein
VSTRPVPSGASRAFFCQTAESIVATILRPVAAVFVADCAMGNMAEMQMPMPADCGAP